MRPSNDSMLRGRNTVAGFAGAAALAWLFLAMPQTVVAQTATATPGDPQVARGETLYRIH